MIKYLKHNTIIKIAVFVIIGLVLLAVAGSLLIGLARSFSIVLGSVLILILPGLSVTLIFFPDHDSLFDSKNENKNSPRTLDILERLALGGILSIIISSIMVFGLYHIIGAERINLHNFVLASVFLNIIVGAIAFWKQKRYFM